MTAAETIADRWRAVRAAVEEACRAAGRAPADVTIVAVSKKHPPSAIDEVVAAGAADVGENYAQALAAKQAAVTSSPRWHFIGRLQRNKVKLVAGKVALVHAVDSVELGAELGRRAAALGVVQPVLAAINVGGEAQKSGVDPAGAAALVDGLRAIAGLRLDGLMTMPPPADDPESVRPVFAALRALRDRLATAPSPLPHLSMGMSADFAVAIACGATLVRIGSAIFGDRI
ncbi:MAG TPA: YggS family pyridoxal phosphate-dependent enzyme [Kofleriaceae bacterium]|nr:YggS family pyridoxal phosphate-dependent enzyme [Kofleriaceae bacterium]